MNATDLQNLKAEAAAIAARFDAAKDNAAETELLKRQYGERRTHLEERIAAAEPLPAPQK